jgi:hypothetical protein
MDALKFVRVKVSFKKSAVDPACYEKPIQEHAKEGSELIQIFVENPAAVPSEYVLIFKRSNAA